MSKTETKILFAVITFSVILRIAAAYFFGDTRVDMEWGMLVHNLEVTGVLGLNTVVDNFTALPMYAEPDATVLPSVFMPPLYAYYILFLKLVSNNFVSLINVLIFSQIILSVISILIFFKILIKFCKFKVSLFFLLAFSLFPLYVYSSVQASSITLQIFLLIIFFYNIVEYLESKKNKNLITFSIAAGFLILIRGEFFIFFIISLFYFFVFYKINLKSFFISIIISIILISPYLKRNYDNFQSLVLTKSFGFNLLKGNNSDFKVEGSYDFILKNYNQSTLKIKADNNYEIKLDDFYKKKALQIIKEQPFTYLELYFKKVLSFLFLDINSSYLNYYHPLHVMPKILISIVSFFGAIINLKKKGFFQFLSIFYFSNIFLFSIFFILPRYSLILLPVQLLLSIKVIEYLRRKIFNKFL
jgi:hypothetical protein